ncbi:MAG: hypothetical protein EA402_07085 [Planctomycetota bacterium]|nr:MAG: hypothetical protein EA402_07085 [Planctomycetota bacterium]
MMALLPALCLAVLGLILPQGPYSLALLAASGLTAVTALMGLVTLRLVAAHGVTAVLAGIVGGMMLRLVLVAVFCLLMAQVPEVHLLTACLAAAAGLVAALIIDSALVARSLSVKAVSAMSATEIAGG